MTHHPAVCLELDSPTSDSKKPPQSGPTGETAPAVLA